MAAAAARNAPPEDPHAIALRNAPPEDPHAIALRRAMQVQAERARLGLVGQVLPIVSDDVVNIGNRIGFYRENLPEMTKDEKELRIEGDTQLVLCWNGHVYQCRVGVSYGSCDVVLYDRILEVSIRSHGVFECVKFSEADADGKWKLVDYQYNDPHEYAGPFE